MLEWKQARLTMEEHTKNELSQNCKRAKSYKTNEIKIERIL